MSASAAKVILRLARLLLAQVDKFGAAGYDAIASLLWCRQVQPNAESA